MFEEILNAICDYSSRKIKVSYGTVILVTLVSFVVGLLTGSLIGSLAAKKKVVVKCGSKDFDADEYVRTLNFDGEDK
ncbi:MAG: hypothetical protein ACI4KF_11090 [Huintestinicola sp.]